MTMMLEYMILIKKTKMWIFLQVPDFFFGDDLLFGLVLIDALSVTGEYNIIILVSHIRDIRRCTRSLTCSPLLLIFLTKEFFL
jgi:hypothetical protein